MRGVSCITSDTSGVHSGRGQRQPTAGRPKGGRQQGCGLATEKGVAWPGLAVLGGSGEGPGGTWCMEDGTTSAGSMRFGQSHLLTPTARLGHPPRQPVSAGDARSGKRREDAACRVSTAHVREGHNAVAVTNSGGCSGSHVHVKKHTRTSLNRAKGTERFVIPFRPSKTRAAPFGLVAPVETSCRGCEGAPGRVM